MAGPIWSADSSWLAGRTVAITGATSGIGLATARALARFGARLRLVGRDPAAAESAERELRQASPEVDVEFFLADLSQQTETRRVADWLNQNPSLSALVNNVGVVHQSREFTVDGIERVYAINYVNQVLLTRLVLPLLARSGDAPMPSRIVMVSSDGHRRAVPYHNDFQGPRLYIRNQAYRQSKLAQCLFTAELARRLQGRPVTINALCPGPVRTSLGTKHTRGLRRVLWGFTMSFFRDVDDGASTVVYAAAADELHGVTGRFFERCRQTSFGRLVSDRQMAATVWTDTCQRLHLPVELELAR
uniref:SDR family NAD(P)-dependent oxidoreductase n=1 Tax=Schlesneria paludicola TaxID=360056 RepID=A0A7C2K196_9PLAN